MWRFTVSWGPLHVALANTRAVNKSRLPNTMSETVLRHLENLLKTNSSVNPVMSSVHG